MKRKNLFSLMAVLCTAIISVFALTACGEPEAKPNTPQEPKTVTVTIKDDEKCFDKTMFTIDVGTVLNKAEYENVVKVNRRDKVYFVGKWQDETGAEFNFDTPITKDVTIKPTTLISVYDETINTFPVTIKASYELIDNEFLTTVILPTKSPYNGNSFQNSTLVGAGVYDEVFNGFNQIVTAIIPEGIWNVNGPVFYNCTSLKEVYFEDYLYNMSRAITGDFLKGCTAMEKIYFATEDMKNDFKKMLDDKIANSKTTQEEKDNLMRFYDMLEVKQTPNY